MVISSVFDFDVLKVLGYGLAGFSFLLMFFAFLLLRQAITANTDNPKVFNAIKYFMALSLVMSILIGAFTFINHDFKKQELATTQQEVKTQTDNIQTLIVNKSNDSITHAIANNKSTTNEEFKKAVAKQKIILDTLEKKIDENPNADSTTKTEFKKYKKDIATITDSLSKPNISITQKDDLTLKYRDLNRKISVLPVEAVKQNNFNNAVKMKAFVRE